MFIKAYASGGAGGRGTSVAGQPRGRRNETQSQYYRRVGTSGLGATSRTRGRQATIRPARGR